jgi:hypothetical protein
MVSASDINRIDWDGLRVHTRTGLSDLTHSGTVTEPEREKDE